MGRKLVEFSMARQEGNGNAIMLQNLDGRRGVTPWCERVDRCHGCVAFNLRKASAAYYGDVDGPWRDLLARQLAICQW